MTKPAAPAPLCQYCYGRAVLRLAELAFLGFVALMAVDQPAPPVPVHAEWADALLPLAALGETL